MITHVVLFRWKPEMPAGQLEAIGAALNGLPPVIPSIVTYQHGPDVGASTVGNWDYAIVATFADVDGWREYDVHPAHDAARADHIRPWVAERTTTQFQP